RRAGRDQRREGNLPGDRARLRSRRMTSLALPRPSSTAVARMILAQHSKSFALASALLGRRTRDQTALVYTWCRRVDDAVDAAMPGDDHPSVLARLASELDAVYAGTARDPVLAALGDVVRERAIPRRYPEELLAGMAMDVAG